MTCVRSTYPWFIKSSSRPGVATRMSTSACRRAYLRSLADATVHDRAAQAGEPAVDRETCRDLRRKFARRCEDEGPDGAAVTVATVAASLARVAAASGQPLQRGQGEGGRLASSGLRTTHQIPTVQHGGNGLRLNACGCVVTGGTDGTQKRIR